VQITVLVDVRVFSTLLPTHSLAAVVADPPPKTKPNDMAKSLREAVQAFITLIPAKLQVAVEAALAARSTPTVKAMGFDSDPDQIIVRGVTLVLPPPTASYEDAVTTGGFRLGQGVVTGDGDFTFDGRRRLAAATADDFSISSSAAAAAVVVDDGDVLQKPDAKVPYALHTSSITSGTSNGDSFISYNAHDTHMAASAAAGDDEVVPLQYDVTASPGGSTNTGVYSQSYSGYSSTQAAAIIAEWREVLDAAAANRRKQLPIKRFKGGFARVMWNDESAVAINGSPVKVQGAEDTITGSLSFNGNEYNFALNGGSVLSAQRVQCIQDIVVDAIYTAAPWLVYNVSGRA
jgi:hypothetical protein